MAHASHLLQDIGLSIVFAAAASHVARALKQPLILGYVLGGVLLGSHLGFGLVTDEASVELMSEIGLILLLFMIGLEINLRELAKMGWAMLAIGAAQFLGCVAMGWACFNGMGYSNGGGRFDLLYISVAVALSSTLIVVKLLSDKFETGTAAGRLTLGVLVLQDLWAIAFMAFQPNLLDPRLGSILTSLLQGAVLVAAAFALSRYALARLFQAAGKAPELVLLSATAWCFLVAGLAQKAGLSKEMGALIAGMSIAAFPYGTDVVSKLGGVRDFFVTLFFVSLGLKVPMPDRWMLGVALFCVAFVFLSRVLSIVPVTWLLGLGTRLGLVTAVNLSQVSEFSLVIVSLGVGYGHLSPQVQPLVLTAMLAASVVSTYLIYLNDRIARGANRLLELVGHSEGAAAEEDERSEEARPDIVLLGCFRAGEALLDIVAREAPELKSRILVVDYNPALRARLTRQGYRWVYGDLSHPQTLHEIGIEEASLVICSISDTFLKGTTNRRLLGHLKELAPHARLVMTADEPAEAKRLEEDGAQEAVVPGRLTGARLFEVLRAAAASSVPA